VDNVALILDNNAQTGDDNLPAGDYGREADWEDSSSAHKMMRNLGQMRMMRTAADAIPDEYENKNKRQSLTLKTKPTLSTMVTFTSTQQWPINTERTCIYCPPQSVIRS
jgi:hypothetical protein